MRTTAGGCRRAEGSRSDVRRCIRSGCRAARRRGWPPSLRSGNQRRRWLPRRREAWPSRCHAARSADGRKRREPGPVRSRDRGSRVGDEAFVTAEERVPPAPPAAAAADGPGLRFDHEIGSVGDEGSVDPEDRTERGLALNLRVGRGLQSMDREKDEFLHPGTSASTAGRRVRNSFMACSAARTTPPWRP